jgi:CheY-like chemotaxis protein
MPRRQSTTHTILHFCCDDRDLTLRAELLAASGYRVLNSSNGFETIELCTREPVDAVVLDLDHNRAEVEVIAREIKQLHPRLPTIVLTEASAHIDGIHELADAIVPRENPPALVQSLARLLSPSGNPDAIGSALIN